MMPRSALSLVSVLLLVFSLGDVEANVSHRRTRGSTLARSDRKLGIGYQGRAYTDSSKSKSGSSGKEGSKSKGSIKPTKTPTAKPTESTISGRIPVFEEKTGKPTPAWFDDKKRPGDSDPIDGSGSNTQTIIGVIGDGSNTTDSNGSDNNEGEGSEGSDGSDGSDGIFDNGNNDGSTNIVVDNESEDEDGPGGKKPPKDVDNEEIGGVSPIGNDSSTEDDGSNGVADTDNTSDSATDSGADSGTGSGTGSDSENNSDNETGLDAGNDADSGNDEDEGSSSTGIGLITGSDSDVGGSDETGTEGEGEKEEGKDDGKGKGDGKGDGKGKGDDVSDQDGTGDEINSNVVTGRDEDGNGSDGETSETDGSSNNENGGASTGGDENNAGNDSGSDQSEGSEVDTDGADNNNMVNVSDPSTVEDWGTAPDDYDSDASTAVFCPDVSADKEVLINWIYAVEFLPEMTSEQKSQAVTIMELKLVSELLQCNDQVALPGKLRHRHLAADGVAGLNYLPLDAKNENVVCFYSDTNSTGGVCETYFGRMEMYLEANTEENIAITSMLYKIRAVFQKSEFPAVNGIVRVWYLDPQLSDVDGIADGGVIITDGGTPPGDSSYSTGTMIAFAALGISVFAALVLGAFRMRRNENDVITTFEHSTVTGSATTPNGSYGAKLGAFVLPNSYKLDDANGMSSIPEDDDDADSRYNCSVMISDGGFTSDGDSRADPFSGASFDNVLGANTDVDDDLNNDMLFSDSRVFSDHRRNNLVSGAEVGLGVKHSTVDVHHCTSARCTICNYKPKDVEFIHKSPTTPDVSTGNFFPDDEGNDAEIS